METETGDMNSGAKTQKKLAIPRKVWYNSLSYVQFV